jgi:excisionase family DNA binding protein
VTVANETTSDLAPSSEAAAAVCVRIDRAMRMLGIGKTKLYELIGTGELETIHVGRRTLVLRESIDAMVQRLRQPAGGQSHRVP